MYSFQPIIAVFDFMSLAHNVSHYRIRKNVFQNETKIHTLPFVH